MSRSNQEESACAKETETLDSAWRTKCRGAGHEVPGMIVELLTRRKCGVKSNMGVMQVCELKQTQQTARSKSLNITWGMGRFSAYYVDVVWYGTPEGYTTVHIQHHIFILLTRYEVFLKRKTSLLRNLIKQKRVLQKCPKTFLSFDFQRIEMDLILQERI